MDDTRRWYVLYRPDHTRDAYLDGTAQEAETASRYQPPGWTLARLLDQATIDRLDRVPDDYDLDGVDIRSMASEVMLTSGCGFN